MKTFLKKVFNRFLRSSDLFQEIQNRLDVVEQNIGRLVYRTGAIHSGGEKVTDVALDKVSLQALYTEILRTQEAIQATQGMVMDSIRESERVEFLLQHFVEQPIVVNGFLYLENCAESEAQKVFERDKQKLSKPYKDFIDKMQTLCTEVDTCNWWRLKQSFYQFVIANQNRLEEICAHLDENSNKILYRQLLLWSVTPLISSAEFYCLTSLTDPQYQQKSALLKKVDAVLGYEWAGERGTTDMSWADHYQMTKENIHKGDYVIDGGAFHGETAEIMDKLVGNTGKVFAFEPFDDSYEVCRSLNLPNTTLVKSGLSAKTGEMSFHICEGDHGSNLVCEGGEVKIHVVSIDDFVKEHNLERVDFIKMDIEGSERSALEGAQETIKRFVPMLAISIYHENGRDIIDVGHYMIKTFGHLYDFSVLQANIAWTETTMFAKKRQAK